MENSLSWRLEPRNTGCEYPVDGNPYGAPHTAATSMFLGGNWKTRRKSIRTQEELAQNITQTQDRTPKRGAVRQQYVHKGFS